MGMFFCNFILMSCKSATCKIICVTSRGAKYGLDRCVNWRPAVNGLPGRMNGHVYGKSVKGRVF